MNTIKLDDLISLTFNHRAFPTIARSTLKLKNTDDLAEQMESLRMALGLETEFIFNDEGFPVKAQYSSAQVSSRTFSPSPSRPNKIKSDRETANNQGLTGKSGDRFPSIPRSSSWSGPRQGSWNRVAEFARALRRLQLNPRKKDSQQLDFDSLSPAVPQVLSPPSNKSHLTTYDSDESRANVIHLLKQTSDMDSNACDSIFETIETMCQSVLQNHQQKIKDIEKLYVSR